MDDKSVHEGEKWDKLRSRPCTPKLVCKFSPENILRISRNSILSSSGTSSNIKFIFVKVDGVVLTMQAFIRRNPKLFKSTMQLLRETEILWNPLEGRHRQTRNFIEILRLLRLSSDERSNGRKYLIQSLELMVAEKFPNLIANIHAYFKHKASSCTKPTLLNQKLR